MRVVVFALGLSLLVQIAAAFELEESRHYPAPGTETVVLRILSTADVAVFEPIILAFQKQNPGVTIAYDVAGSSQVMVALNDEGAGYDLAISSAMDLQTKLANDGFALPYRSDATRSLPDWARWRDRVFAFTQEAAILILSEKAFETLPEPHNRAELIDLFRDHPDVFQNRIGTYDIRTSGTGYLFATQESRNTEAYWRLTEVMGRLGVRLYCCSGQMIADVASGKLALAYNVLDSYSQSVIARTPGIRIVRMDDFVAIMLRSALIPETATHIEEAGRMIDFLIGLKDRPDLQKATHLPPIGEGGESTPQRVRPIRLGPGLLVFLDRLRRQSFLESWTSAILQN